MLYQCRRQGVRIQPPLTSGTSRNTQRLYLVHPGGIAQAPPATASSARSATVVHYGQHVPYTREDPVIRVGSSQRLAINRPPGRRVGRSGPRSSPFHSLDGIEDTRTRHDIPPPAQPPDHDRAATSAPMSPPGRIHHPPPPAMTQDQPSSIVQSRQHRR